MRRAPLITRPTSGRSSGCGPIVGDGTVAALVAALLLGAGVSSAAAHLRAIGGSLIDLLGRSDGVIVARAVEATRDAPASHTRMRTVRGLAGATPPEEFLLRNATSVMRYARDQTAIVVVARDGERWSALQSAGEGLVVGDDALDPSTADFVASLWRALHDATPQGDVGGTLRRGLRLPHPKIRLLAALDIAELAHHEPGLTPATRDALRADLQDPELDPAVGLALSRALRDPVH